MSIIKWCLQVRKWAVMLSLGLITLSSATFLLLSQGVFAGLGQAPSEQAAVSSGRGMGIRAIDPLIFTSATNFSLGVWPDSVKHLTLDSTTVRAALIGSAKDDPVQIAAKATQLLQALLDTRIPIANLPVDDPDKTTNPNRPDLFWAGTNLVGRSTLVTVTWTGIIYMLELRTP